MGKLRVVAASVVCLSAASAYANPPTDPFGFKFGAPITDYDCQPGNAATAQYLCVAPRPHPDLPLNYVFAMPGIGVCDVWSINHYTDSNRAARKFEKLVEQLQTRFQLTFNPSGDAKRLRYRDAKTYSGYEISVTLSDEGTDWRVSVLIAGPIAEKCKAAVDALEAGAF